ncbi:MAG: carbohydrate binding family 9 domain-containing protein [Gemmatimonadaceae bacterium]|nr:carbohydrate binding family 9 domain-containing protein [Gemmatimonadaceae bacterium]
MRIASGELSLNGRLDEPAWAIADSITSLRQSDPSEGSAGSERTVVRFLADSKGLWVGVWAFDRDPSGIRHAQLRRDASFNTDDSFSLMLSPMADKRTGFIFTVNPNGALYDAEITSFESESAEWDGVWDARARIDAAGWQAELFIPWQTLRYPAGADAWDINVRRFIRRTNESQLWQAWRRSEGIRFLERAGSLRGLADVALALGGSLPDRARVELRPYAASAANLATRDFRNDPTGIVRTGGTTSADVGLDAKLAPSPTLTLDLTLNADFAQAEVDRQIVNLTRFPLFFPEQRPFFTEGAGIFEFGRRQETQLFYSRRIGLDASGTPVPLLGGARLTGRIGRQQVGALVAREGGAAPSTDAVVRARRDVLGRGYIGAMGTMREAADGSSAPAGGVDFNFPFIVGGDNLVLLGALAVDGGPATGDPVFGRLMIDYPNDHADIVVRFDRIGDGFAPPLGFVRQAGIMRYSGNTAITPRPRSLGAFGRWLSRHDVRRLRLNALGWQYVERLEGGVDNASFTVQPLGAQFEDGSEFAVRVVQRLDVPDRAFALFPGAEIAGGDYRWRRTEASWNSSPGRVATLEVTASTGSFYTGMSRDLAIEAGLRLEPHVLIALELERVAFTLPTAAGSDARFTANTARARIDAAPSARFNATLFTQWDNASERLALNARLRWIRSPGQELFVVWNSNWPTFIEREAGGVPWRRPAAGGLVVKYVHFLRY